MYRLCLPKSRFEGALYRVLLPWRADGIYRIPLATVTEFIGESLMTFSAPRAVTFIDTLLSLFTRAARFHFRYLYGRSRGVVLTVNPRDRTLLALLSRRQ